MKKPSLESENFKKGLEILKQYDKNPDINDMGDEYYVGNLNLIEDKITKDEVKELQKLGFHYYEEAECFIYNGSSKSIY